MNIKINIISLYKTYGLGSVIYRGLGTIKSFEKLFDIEIYIDKKNYLKTLTHKTINYIVARRKISFACTYCEDPIHTKNAKKIAAFVFLYGIYLVHSTKIKFEELMDTSNLQKDDDVFVLRLPMLFGI